MGFLKINGKQISGDNSISIIGDGNKINGVSVINGQVIINGKKINLKDYSDDYIVNVEIEGDIYGDISTNGNVKVSGNCKNIDTNGNVEIGNNVEGNIDTNGHIYCYGDINGDIDTNGNVSLKRK